MGLGGNCKLVPFLALPLASCLFSAPTTHLTDVAAAEVSPVLTLSPLEIGGDSSVEDAVAVFELVFVCVSRRFRHKPLLLSVGGSTRHAKSAANEEISLLARALKPAD